MIASDRKRAQAASFGRGADVYERARPTYPEAALDWLLPPAARDVLDLGAGTGKLTRALAARGLAVVAVDPSPEMLGALRRGLPEVAARVGSAEALPVADAAFDAVTAAQAWHWVEPSRAVPEVARVLRPGGTLGLVWNERDDRVPWVAAFNRIVDGGDPVSRYAGKPVVGAPFGRLDRAEFGWTYTLGADGLVDLAASRSIALTMPDDARDALLREVRRLFDRVAAGRATVDMPYRTRCFRARLGGPPGQA